MDPRPLLLAHRGARRITPENTLQAFDLALAHGCHGFEFDVRRTRDRELVIFHDAALKRKRVAATSFADLQRRKPDLTTLAEVFRRFGKEAFLDIELKVAGTEREVIRLLTADPPRRGYVVSSFIASVVQTVQQNCPQAQTGLICKSQAALRRWRKMRTQMLIVHRRLVTAALVNEAHEREQKILVWTVNRRSEMLRFARLGVDGIISDDTQRLCDVLGPRR